MIEGFNIKNWRNYYDQIHILGKYLKDSLPGEHGQKPAFKISVEEQEQIARDIDRLSSRCMNYLDKWHIKAPDPLWVYKKHDKTTHESEPEFAYRHLMEIPAS